MYIENTTRKPQKFMEYIVHPRFMLVQFKSIPFCSGDVICAFDRGEDQLVGRSTDQLVGWLADQLVCWSADQLVCSGAAGQLVC